MKIIAKIDNDTWLVSATSRELAQATGYGYESSVPVTLRPQVGATVNISEAFTTTETLIGSDREVETAKLNLNKLLGALDKLQGVLQPKIATIKSKLPS
jgi:hypothetical protein